MCLSDADRKIAIALSDELIDLGLCFGENVYLACTINLCCYLSDLFFDGIRKFIAVNRILRLVLAEDGESLVSKVDSAFAALSV